MKTSEIRDRLLEERALYQQSVRDSNAAIESILSVLNGITQEALDETSKIGVSLDAICSFDLQRMKNDPQYLEICQAELNRVILKLHEYLEGELTCIV